MAKDKPFDFSVEIRKSKESKQQYARLWDLSRLFLDGRQNIVYDRRQDTLRVLDSDEEERYADNQIKPLYRFVTSSLAVEYPAISALPASPSVEDILKARTSQEAVQYYLAQIQFKQLFAGLVDWLAATGNAVLHTFVDGGEIKTKVRSSYDFFLPKGVTDQRDAAWQSVRTLFRRNVLRDTYAREVDRKAVDKAETFTTKGSILAEDTVPEDMVEVFDVYHADGRHEVRLEGHVFSEGRWNTRVFPARHVWYMRTPGVLWGQGLVADLIDDQILLNRKNRQIVQAIENMADPYILVAMGSGVPIDAFRRGSDKVIRYASAGTPPSFLPGITLPGEAFADVQRIRASMQDKAGVHSSSLGKTAAGITSAKHVDALKESDRSQLQPTMGALEAATVDLARTFLVMARDTYSERKWMRFLDATGALIHRQLDVTQIEEDPEIILEAGSLFRNETLDRRQRVLELMALGLITPAQAIEEIGFGTGNRIAIDKIGQIAHAQELLDAVRRGLDIEVYPTDDASAIRRVFEEFMRTRQFYDLPLPLQDHVAGTFLRILAMGAAQAPGAPAQPPGPPGSPAAAPSFGRRPSPGGPAQVPGRPIPGEPAPEDGSASMEAA